MVEEIAITFELIPISQPSISPSVFFDQFYFQNWILQDFFFFLAQVLAGHYPRRQTAGHLIPTYVSEFVSDAVYLCLLICLCLCMCLLSNYAIFLSFSRLYISCQPLFLILSLYVTVFVYVSVFVIVNGPFYSKLFSVSPKALTGFLLVTTREGKLLYISENVTDFLGHSMVRATSVFCLCLFQLYILFDCVFSNFKNQRRLSKIASYSAQTLQLLRFKIKYIDPVCSSS